MEKAVKLKHNGHNCCQTVFYERGDCVRNAVSFLEDEDVSGYEKIQATDTGGGMH